MQHKTKPLFFTFQLKALKILQVNLFFPEPVTFLFLYFFAAFANYSKEYRLSFFLRTYLRLFLFIHSYKASHCKALVRVFLLLARRSSGDRGYCLLSCHFCCFYFIILYLFFWCRTPRRWVNPSEWNHNAPHFRNIHRGWLILRIFSHHLRLVLLISVNL